MTDAFTYAQDQRTFSEVNRDFNFGKYNEKVIFTFLSEPKFKLGKDEVIGEMALYEPDCFWMFQDRWIPIDIKFTLSMTNEMDFKKSQTNALASWGGYFLIGNPKGKTFIQAMQVQMMGQEILAADSKINKDSFRYIFTDEDWSAWKKLMPFKDKDAKLLQSI